MSNIKLPTNIKLPIGTKIYLTKKNAGTLYIKPDMTLLNDNLYVAYDVKINGIIVIPKDTRVVGDWITESAPSFAAQLQLTRIFLEGSGQVINADSSVFDLINEFNGKEINNAGFLYQTAKHKFKTGVNRRIVKFQCRTKTLSDNNLNSKYIEINTLEIPVTITVDFIIAIALIPALTQH